MILRVSLGMRQLTRKAWRRSSSNVAPKLQCWAISRRRSKKCSHDSPSRRQLSCESKRTRSPCSEPRLINWAFNISTTCWNVSRCLVVWLSCRRVRRVPIYDKNTFLSLTGWLSFALLTASMNCSSKISDRFPSVRLSPALCLKLSQSLTTVLTRRRSACSVDIRAVGCGVVGRRWAARGSTSLMCALGWVIVRSTTVRMVRAWPTPVMALSVFVHWSLMLLNVSRTGLSRGRTRRRNRARPKPSHRLSSSPVVSCCVVSKRER